MDGSTEKESQETKVREAVEKAMKAGGSDPNVPHPVLVCAELEILPIAFICYSLIDLLYLFAQFCFFLCTESFDEPLLSC